MKKFIVVTLSFLLVAKNSHGRVVSTELPWEKADKLFASSFSRETPGCAVQFRIKGSIAYERAFGSFWLPGPHRAWELSAVPMTVESKIRIAAVTKPIIAMAILRLRDRILADNADYDILDKDLDELNQERGAIKEWRIDDKFKRFTIRQLLNHTAGLRREAPRPMFVGGDGNLRDFMGIGFSESEYPMFRSEPGMEWSYSDLGYSLAVVALESVIGLGKWRDFVRDEIFNPLNMNSSSIENPFPLRRNKSIADGYTTWSPADFKVTPENESSRFFAGGGVISTVGDLGRFAAGIESKAILSGSSYVEWVRATELDRSSNPYALGWNVDSRDPSEVKNLYHMGSGDGSYTALELDKRDGCETSFALLCNVNELPNRMTWWELSRDVRRAYCDALNTPVEPGVLSRNLPEGFFDLSVK